MLSFACSCHPLVCEDCDRKLANSGLRGIKQCDRILIQIIKKLRQLIEITKFILTNLFSLWSSPAPRPNGRRTDRPDGQVATRAAHQCHVGVIRHKVTTLRRLVDSRGRSAARRKGHACSGHTMRAICIAEAKKHSRDTRAIRYARTYLALGASGVPPIDGAADASAG